ncbi:MAG: GNAT family N-acetyltransferase [Litorimonas sp.]
MPSPHFTATIISQISDVSASDWDALLPAGIHPFLSHRFLLAMEESGSATAETGWMPRHIWVEDESRNVVGAAPLYVKSHSQGEYVFDHAWANALAQAGINYYPKLQCSVPFTPATGPRLLAKTPESKLAVAGAMMQACAEWGMSGVHLTFLQEEDRTALDQLGFAAREDRQFHFINRGYADFDAFLASLSSRKRKNIRKERKAVQDGVSIKRLIGDDLKDEHWDVFYRCYLDTGERKWGRPYLTRQFFDQMQQTMRDEICLVMASMDGTPIAAALNYIGSEALYGRNWGALVHKPFLHFELCYYQAIEAGLELGLPRVEAGAQGEHKLARGYEPVVTHSAHWLTHPGLMKGVEDYLVRERAAVEHEVDILAKHTPFRKG